MIITIKCPDKIGIISTISTILKKADCNIVSMRQHVAVDAPLFFTRIVTKDHEEKIEALQTEFEQVLDKNAQIHVNPVAEKKIVILVTKEYHCLGDILCGIILIH